MHLYKMEREPPASSSHNQSGINNQGRRFSEQMIIGLTPGIGRICLNYLKQRLEYLDELQSACAGGQKKSCGAAQGGIYIVRE